MNKQREPYRKVVQKPIHDTALFIDLFSKSLDLENKIWEMQERGVADAYRRVKHLDKRHI